MCGLIGILGRSPVAARLLDGLRRLEYRGYDLGRDGGGRGGRTRTLERAGKLHHLAEALAVTPLDGEAGIGHTRWATHGGPTEVTPILTSPAKLLWCIMASSKIMANWPPS